MAAEVPALTATKYSLTIFSLPLFLREQIYDDIFCDIKMAINVDSAEFLRRQQLSSKYASREEPREQTRHLTLAVSQTSRLIRAESLPRFYKQVIFRVRGTSYSQHRFWNSWPGSTSNESMHEGASGAPKNNCRGKGEAKALDAHLESVWHATHHVRRLMVSAGTLHHLGLDKRSWVWAPDLAGKFSQLRELHIDIALQCCGCPDVGLAEKWGINDHHQGDDVHPSDGKIVRSLVSSAPKHLQIRAFVAFGDFCVGRGCTRIELCPNQDRPFHLIAWYNHTPCNQALIELLKDFGLAREVEEMRKMIEGN